MSTRTESIIPIVGSGLDLTAKKTIIRHDCNWSSRAATFDVFCMSSSSNNINTLHDRLRELNITTVRQMGSESEFDSDSNDTEKNEEELKKQQEDLSSCKTQQIEAMQKQIQGMAEENTRLKQEQEATIAGLRKELSIKTSEVKNLQLLSCGLGKEKDIMSKELMLKESIIADLEEHLKDLKIQNGTLACKLETYARDGKANKLKDSQGSLASLLNRNKELSQHLLKSSEGCRILKRKCKDLEQQNQVSRREIANLKASMQKQEKLIQALDCDKKTLLKEQNHQLNVSNSNSSLHHTPLD